MAATFEQVEAALLAPWVPIADGGLGEWTATPYVTYENVDFDTKDFGDGPWMRVEINGGTRRTVDMSATQYGWPEVYIAAHVPLGRGKAQARALLDAAVAMYAGRLFTAGTSTIKEYSISQPVQLPADGWYKLAVNINMHLF